MLDTLGTVPQAEAMIFSPRRWNVFTSTRCPASFITLFFRSSTEALVNESANISSGAAFLDLRRYFMSPMVVVVFPVPAPAMISLDLTSYAMAISCCSSRL